jgi:hypothetical protein
MTGSLFVIMKHSYDRDISSAELAAPEIAI